MVHRAMQVHRVAEATAGVEEVLVGHRVVEGTSVTCNGLLPVRATEDSHKVPQVHQSQPSLDQVHLMINPNNRVGSEPPVSTETTRRRLGRRQIHPQRSSRRGQYLIMIVLRRCLHLLLLGNLRRRQQRQQQPRRLL